MRRSQTLNSCSLNCHPFWAPWALVWVKPNGKTNFWLFADAQSTDRTGLNFWYYICSILVCNLHIVLLGLLLFHYTNFTAWVSFCQQAQLLTWCPFSHPILQAALTLTMAKTAPRCESSPTGSPPKNLKAHVIFLSARQLCHLPPSINKSSHVPATFLYGKRVPKTLFLHFSRFCLTT